MQPFAISGKLSPKEITCMEWESLFPAKNQKNYFKMSNAKISFIQHVKL